MQRSDAPMRERDTTTAAVPTAAEPTPRRIDSKSLLGAAHVVEIAHVGQIYRLRRTSLGKLILTK